MKKLGGLYQHVLLALAIAGTLAFAGCGQDRVSGPAAGNSPTFEIVDPLAGVLNSVDGTTPPEPGRCIDRLAEVLGLTEEQEAAFLDAYLTLRTGLEALRDQVEAGTLTLAEARLQASALRDQFEAALQVILTAEQWNQLQELRQNRDGCGCGYRDALERWKAWLNEIGATNDQVTAILAALETFQDSMASIRAQVANGEITWEEARIAAGAARATFIQALREILTPEQFQQLMELLPDGPGPGGDGGGGRR